MNRRTKLTQEWGIEQVYYATEYQGQIGLIIADNGRYTSIVGKARKQFDSHHQAGDWLECELLKLDESKSINKI